MCKRGILFKLLCIYPLNTFHMCSVSFFFEFVILTDKLFEHLIYFIGEFIVFQIQGLYYGGYTPMLMTGPLPSWFNCIFKNQETKLHNFCVNFEEDDSLFSHHFWGDFLPPFSFSFPFIWRHKESSFSKVAQKLCSLVFLWY